MRLKEHPLRDCHPCPDQELSYDKASHEDHIIGNISNPASWIACFDEKAHHRQDGVLHRIVD